MAISLTRRTVLMSTLLAIPAIAVSRVNAQTKSTAAAAAIAELERNNGGRLGIAVLDTASGLRIEHRINERFAMCSTFKILAAAAVLTRVDRGLDDLNRRVVFAKSDLVEYSPTTMKHVGAGMTLAEIGEAAVTLSDNTAGNLLLAAIGGPAGLTAYARTLGDELTRLDRIETELNEATPGDLRDTTTPGAMLEDVYKILLGDALASASRQQLTTWLVGNKTGDERLRAGLPKGWRVGDRTGSGGYGVANDVAIVWPPERAPIIIAAYFAESPKSPEERNRVLADVARIVSGALG